MVELWLIRHGETAWSLSGAHTSRTDLPLTEQGRARAASLGEYLQGMAFAKVLVSPMSRALETCEIAGFGAQAEVDDGLREWDYGDAEGKTTPQLRAEYNDPAWGVWNRELINGEALRHVGQRADVVIGRALAGTPDNGKWRYLLKRTFCVFSPHAGLGWRPTAERASPLEREA